MDGILQRISELKKRLGLEKESFHSPVPGYKNFNNNSQTVYFQNPNPSPTPTPSPELRKSSVLAAETQRQAITPTPTMIPPKSNPNARLDPNVQQFIENTIFPVTRKYEIPDPVAAGMFAAEGRLSGLGANRNNFYNIGAFDSNPNQATYFETPEQGIEAYAKFMKGEGNYASPKHKESFTNAYNNRKNVVEMLRGIQEAGYAGDPKTYKQRAKNNFNSYMEFIMATPEFQKYFK